MKNNQLSINIQEAIERVDESFAQKAVGTLQHMSRRSSHGAVVGAVGGYIAGGNPQAAKVGAKLGSAAGAAIGAGEVAAKAIARKLRERKLRKAQQGNNNG